MFNIGPLELMIIAIVALLVVGPQRLPEVGRSVGRGIREFRRAQDDVQRSLRMSLEEDERASKPGAARARLGRDATPAAVDGDGASSAETARADEAPSGQDIAKTIGRGLAELRKAREELQQSFRVDLDDADRTGD